MLVALATSMSVSAALKMLSLVLRLGVIGRVVALWMAAKMNWDNQAILHAVVPERPDAAEHMQKILAIPGPDDRDQRMCHHRRKDGREMKQVAFSSMLRWIFGRSVRCHHAGIAH